SSCTSFQAASNMAVLTSSRCRCLRSAIPMFLMCGCADMQMCKWIYANISLHFICTFAYPHICILIYHYTKNLTLLAKVMLLFVSTNISWRTGHFFFDQ